MRPGLLKALLLLFVGSACGFAIAHVANERLESGGVHRVPYSDDYPFLNEVVRENLGKHFIINFKPLRLTFEEIQSRYEEKTYVYFVYLNNASWIGLGEREPFVAASTIKVPLAMAFLKAVEDKKVSMSDEYTLEELDLDPRFGELYKVGEGTTLPASEFVRLMLEQSDNTAMDAILSIFDRIGVTNPLADVYGFLGWDFSQPIPELGETPDYSTITLKTLANIFITLYDAKYLSIDYSNQILEHLANTPFDTRIAAGVPENVVVSHKIGTADLDKTYSDCGIVYAPNRHYLLCVGSSGGEQWAAERFMADISKAAYNYVISN